MARQLCFFGIALLVVLAYGIEVLSLGWLIVLLILLFLLWFPLRGQVELHIEDEINAVVSLLPLPFWRLPVLRMTRPYHWWRTLGEDLERLEQKKNSSQQTKPVAEDVNPAASHVRQPQAGATAETTPETLSLIHI